MLTARTTTKTIDGGVVRAASLDNQIPSIRQWKGAIRAYPAYDWDILKWSDCETAEIIPTSLRTRQTIRTTVGCPFSRLFHREDHINPDVNKFVSSMKHRFVLDLGPLQRVNEPKSQKSDALWIGEQLELLESSNST